jgi:long-chain acyl-CoA synthetase
MPTLDLIVRRNALRFPDKRALVMNGVARSWRDVDARVDQLAHALRAQGLGVGDRAAILLGNCPEYVELYFAFARAGVIAVPLNYRLNAAECTQILQHADVALLIFGAEYAPLATALATTLPNLTRRWMLGEPPAEAPRHEQFSAVLAAAAATPFGSPCKETDTFAIFYTSGTTGLPKGAMVSHLNLEMNGYNQFVADGSRSGDINLVATPVYHMGAVFMAVTYMMLGCTQVILRQFSPRAWLEALQRERATASLLISTMINAVLNEPSLGEFDRSSLRLVFYGGGPMPPAVLERALREFRCDFTQGYGLTETLEATFLTPDDHRVGDDPHKRARLASAGREAVGADIRIVDDDGRDVAGGTIGEVLVRSRSVIKGYWRAPEETAKAIKDGWFYTGDLGYLDAERYLFVVDRKKDMVISGGVNIYTKEVESALFTHAGVLEAAVIGLPDDHWGEIVTAVVVRRPGSQVSAEALIGHCAETLASFKRPKRVEFVSELPKNPSGKVLKRELRRTLAK